MVLFMPCYPKKAKILIKTTHKYDDIIHIWRMYLIYTAANVMIITTSKILGIWHSKDKFIDIFRLGQGGKDKFNPIYLHVSKGTI